MIRDVTNPSVQGHINPRRALIHTDWKFRQQPPGDAMLFLLESYLKIKYLFLNGKSEKTVFYIP